ncbi:MAG: hypothetical protein D6696_20890 [Acidobacteria bacterium]|nr:MAG: hypothetical protein D6696_20890 [Acidobacteriota bacterium]
MRSYLHPLVLRRAVACLALAGICLSPLLAAAGAGHEEHHAEAEGHYDWVLAVPPHDDATPHLDPTERVWHRPCLACVWQARNGGVILAAAVAATHPPAAGTALPASGAGAFALVHDPRRSRAPPRI